MSFKVGNVEVEDTFAEAFPMYATRLLITALNEKWALTAARVATGFATSIIMSPAEAGLERLVPADKTPDGRVGALIHIYHRSVPELKLQTLVRIGQCILTCPTTALFDGIPKAKRKMHIGEALAKFGDGFEVKDTMYGKTVWRIPVMEGEFIAEDTVGVAKAVAGGNFFILASSHKAALEAAEKAVDEISKKCRNVVLPFPGGIVRSGSKVGSLKYPKLAATTNHLYCPVLRDKVKDTKIPEGVTSVLEIVINGLDVDSVTKAVGVGVRAACTVDGVVKVTAGNYGGKLGPYKIFLKDAVKDAEAL
mgnify:FL=1